jgi:hypothetical protein
VTGSSQNRVHVQPVTPFDLFASNQVTGSAAPRAAGSADQVMAIENRAVMAWPGGTKGHAPVTRASTGAVIGSRATKF